MKGGFSYKQITPDYTKAISITNGWIADNNGVCIFICHFYYYESWIKVNDLLVLRYIGYDSNDAGPGDTSVPVKKGDVITWSGGGSDGYHYFVPYHKE
jgi:hypothetical protein